MAARQRNVGGAKREAASNFDDGGGNWGDAIEQALKLKFRTSTECIKRLDRVIKEGDSYSRAIARYELSLLHSQLGSHEAADEHLRILGFRYKLSERVLRPFASLSTSNIKPGGRSVCRPLAIAYENVLPQGILSRLKEAFGPRAPFWSEHGYPTSEFFSYSIPREDNSSIISQVITLLTPVVNEAFPDKGISNSLESVEWWCHIREESSGFAHQLHFDLDEQSLREWKSDPSGSEDSLRNDLHPLVSSVLYLTGGDSDHGELNSSSSSSAGAPTFVTDQTLEEGSTAGNGWLCQPAENRFLMFDGSLLHGVVPFLPPSVSGAKGSSGGESSKGNFRITLMLGWWGKPFPYNSKSTWSKRSLGPNMPVPKPSRKLRWPESLRPIDEASFEKYQHSAAPSPSDTAITHIPGPIWVPVKGSTDDCVSQTQSAKASGGKPERKNAKAVPAPAAVVEEDADEMEFVDIATLQKLRDAPSVAGKSKTKEAEPHPSKKQRIDPSFEESSEIVFVGKWFLKSLSEIRDDVLG